MSRRPYNSTAVKIRMIKQDTNASSPFFTKYTKNVSPTTCTPLLCTHTSALLKTDSFKITKDHFYSVEKCLRRLTPRLINYRYANLLKTPTEEPLWLRCKMIMVPKLSKCESFLNKDSFQYIICFIDEWLQNDNWKWSVVVCV